MSAKSARSGRSASGCSRRKAARRPAAAASAASVRAERRRSCQAREALPGSAAGASSRTTWALVPPSPRELTPARRGVGPAGQSVSRSATRNGLSSRRSFGLGRWKWRVGGIWRCSSVRTALMMPGRAGGAVEMADVGLHRAQQATAPWRPLPEGLGEGGDLDRVADLGAGAVGLDVADGLGADPRHLQGLGDHLRLAVDARRREAGPDGAVVVDRRAADDGADGVAVAQRVRQPAQHHDPHAVAAHQAARRGVEGPAVAVGGEQAVAVVVIALGLRQADRDAPRQGRVALAGEQALAGQVHGHQRRRAGGLHREARPLEPQPVGDPGGQEVLVVADHQLEVADRVERLRIRQEVEHVGVHAGAGEHPDVAGEAGRLVAGVLESRPGALQEHPLLRIDDLGLAGAVAEERRVELVGARDDPAGPHVAGIAERGLRHPRRPQLLVAEEGDRLDAVLQVVPESLDVGGAGEAPRHADDGDRTFSGGGLAAGRRARPPGRDRRQGAAAEERRQRRHRRIAEEVEQRDLAAEELGQAGVDLRRQQRVAAEIEEVVAGPHAVELEHLAPDAGDRPLELRSGIDVGRLHRGLAALSGSRQGLAVHLAAGRQREGVESHEDRGDHGVRQRQAQMLAQLAEARGRSRRDEIGHQPPVRSLAVRRDHRLAHAGKAPQRRLDLPQLDAEAAHLDLLVDPSQVLEIAVGAVAHQVAGAVEARSRRRAPAPGMGNELLRREVRTAEIAAGEAGAADQQLAGGAEGDGSEPRIGDVEVGVGDRPAEGDGALPGTDAAAGRVHRRLGGAVEVPELGAAGEHRVGQIAGERLAGGHRADARRALPAGIDQQPPGGGGALHQRRPRRGDARRQQAAVRGLLAGRDLDPAADRQGSVDLERRDVEGQRGQGQRRVVRPHAGPLEHGAQQIDQRPVGELHPLGTAGRARGVEDVGEVLRIGRPGERSGVLGVDLCGNHGGIPVQAEQRPGVGGDRPEQRFLRHQHRHAAVLEHHPQPLARMGGIEGDVGAARFEDAEQRHHHLRRALDAEADAHLRPHPHAAQTAGEAVSPLVELAVGQRDAAGAGGRRLGGPRRLLLEQLVDEGFGGPVAAAGVPVDEELPAFRRGEEGELPDGTRRAAGEGPQQRGELVRHPPGGGGVEEVGVVLDPAGDRVGPLGELQGELELGGAGVEVAGAQGEPRQAQGFGLGPLQGEHHLEQRRAAEVAVGMELLDEPAEGELLVSEGGELVRLDPLEELAQRGLPREVAAQRQAVDEEADQPLRLGAGAAGDRGADEQRFLAAPARQQQLEGGEQQHEQRVPRSPPRLPQERGELRRETHRRLGAAERLHGRPRAVGRQVEDQGNAGQRFAPEGELALQRLPLEPLALPDGDVGALHRQPGKGRGGPRQGGRVERRDLPHQHAHRPAVADDVVQIEDGQMALARQPDQQRAQQGAAGEVERPPRLGGGQALRLGVAGGGREGLEIHHRQLHRLLRVLGMDHLHRPAGAGREGGAQGLVAADDLAQARRQRGHVEPPLGLEGRRQVVERAPRLQAIEEPEPLLLERDGELAAPLRAPRLARDAVRLRPAARGAAARLQTPPQQLALLRRQVLQLHFHLRHAQKSNRWVALRVIVRPGSSGLKPDSRRSRSRSLTSL